MGKLIPGVSTHFLFVGVVLPPEVKLTKGRVYKIEEWKKTLSTNTDCYSFYDNRRRLITWYGTVGVVDISFEENLKKILE